MANQQDDLLKIAFTMLKGTDALLATKMEEASVSLDEFFTLPSASIVNSLGLNNNHKLDFSQRNESVSKAKAELDFNKKHSIKTYFITDDDYPFRLRQAVDAPTVLFKLGEADLNMKHCLAFVGTRNATPYGKNFCTQSIQEIHKYIEDCMIVSGLAYGIDSCAHTSSLSSHGITTAVVAHGLDMIYPSANRGLAYQIIKSGGAIVSEYVRGERPFKQRFLQRNRIIAGLCDGVVVAESGIKGGAMSTANTAFSYSRDVMALPGRINDEVSQGCNYLIKRQKAQLVTSGMDIIETMCWDEYLKHVDAVQINLFPEMDETQQKIYEVLKSSRQPVAVDIIANSTQIPIGEIVAALSEMEFEGLVVKYPGNRFHPA